MTQGRARSYTEKSFIQAASALFSGSLVSQLLVALTFVLIAREFGKFTFGLVVAMLGICAVLQDVGDMGTSQWLSREIASRRVDPSVARVLLRRRGYFVIFTGALFGVIGVFAGAPFASAFAVWTYIVGAILNAGLHARLRAEGRFHLSAIHLVGERLLWVGITILLGVLGAHGPIVAALVVASMGVSYLISWLIAPPWFVGGRTQSSPGPTLRGMYRSASHFGLMGLSSDLQQLDATLASGLGSVSIAADVGVASKFTSPAALIASNVSQVLFRDVAADSDGAQESVKAARRLSLLLAAGMILMAPLAPTIAVVVLGSQFANAGPTIFVYVFGTAVAVINQPIASILSARGLEKHVTRYVVFGAVAGLTVGGAFAHQLGAVSFGIGFLLTQAIIFIGCWRLRTGTSSELHRW